jgi:hypothetical protein
VKAWVDAISIAGSMLRVSAPDPLPAGRDTLAVATAIRVFERFPALDRLELLGGSEEALSLARADVERLLAPLSFAALRDRGRWPQVLSRAVQRYAGTDTFPADDRPLESDATPGYSP